MNVEWTERKLDSLTGHKNESHAISVRHVFSIIVSSFLWIVHFRWILTLWLGVMINQVMTNWSRYVKKKRKQKKKEREGEEGGGGSYFSHRQWWVESNHTRPISLSFKRFRSSLQYSWHELVIITAKQVSVVCVCVWTLEATVKWNRGNSSFMLSD